MGVVVLAEQNGQVDSTEDSQALFGESKVREAFGLRFAVQSHLENGYNGSSEGGDQQAALYLLRHDGQATALVVRITCRLVGVLRAGAAGPGQRKSAVIKRSVHTAAL